MDVFDKVEFSEITFDKYIKWFEKYKNNNDVREINFENEVVKKFICGICGDLDVEDSSKKGNQTASHDYFQYVEHT
ncbi:MAG TPA: hypothetical protein DHW61_10450 [Lachnoclostridium phytofermentans]|uniref:Uncharacterized protein n=1 Tax=Lachnoclostridium phytofermentans TaxID=66219 RepID=A0A3D2X6Q8_9FIRM|nr:hypothetical protein [Lachnoclostridium sp.]HCL02812.1 hypothetical protein [Lachnoclostridium phytofermentans]